MSAERPLNDDSIKESQARVSLAYHSISFNCLDDSLLLLSSSVRDDTRYAYFIGFNPFSGDRNVMAAVLREMALTFPL